MTYYYRSRLMCDVLEEMRTCVKTLNFGNLLGLVEEAQSLANRMEAGLEMKNDLERMEEEWVEKKQELKKLEKEIKKHEN